MPNTPQDHSATPTPEEQPRATTATAWRSPRKEGMLTTLPSGNVARIRRTLDLLTLLKTGRIVNPLRSLIEESIRTEGKGDNFDVSKLNSEAMEQFVELLNATLVKCMVEPPVQSPPNTPHLPENASDEQYEAWKDAMEAWEKWEPEPGYISVNDVDLDDKLFIFAVAQGGAASLQTFRELTSERVAPVQDGAGVQHPAERTAAPG